MRNRKWVGLERTCFILVNLEIDMHAITRFCLNAVDMHKDDSLRTRQKHLK